MIITGLGPRLPYVGCDHHMGGPRGLPATPSHSLCEQSSFATCTRSSETAVRVAMISRRYNLEGSVVVRDAIARWLLDPHVASGVMNRPQADVGAR